jgi:hypothetical protein
VPASGAADVDDAVRAAAEAFPAWAAKTPRERSEAMHALARRHRGRHAELSRLESRNVGKPVSIMEFEMDLTLDNWRFFASAGRFLEGRAAGEYMEGYTSMLRREALGVVASIAPWNYPLNMATWKVGSGADGRQHRRAEALRAHPVHGAAPRRAGRRRPAARRPQRRLRPGETAGAALVDHPEVAMVSITGSVAAGKEVARVASQTVKRVHLELGGKAPVVVFDDADLEAVVKGVSEGGFYNSGQDCTAAPGSSPAAHPRRARERARERHRGHPHRRPERPRHRDGARSSPTSSAAGSPAWSTGPASQAPRW